ncbi:hypothetical protein E2C01_088686 [Portunus trituberculatus]|uniref:Uncharacterized protein n=1 Tax=Portunus trituberculatus TaxID=210409 RepID=A0A5B7JGQ3_PORTR|nr:hypothetical protein [Portunus trituberculatus]
MLPLLHPQPHTLAAFHHHSRPSTSWPHGPAHYDYPSLLSPRLSSQRYLRGDQSVTLAPSHLSSATHLTMVSPRTIFN